MIRRPFRHLLPSDTNWLHSSFIRRHGQGRVEWGETTHIPLNAKPVDHTHLKQHHPSRRPLEEANGVVRTPFPSNPLLSLPPLTTRDDIAEGKSRLVSDWAKAQVKRRIGESVEALREGCLVHIRVAMRSIYCAAHYGPFCVTKVTAIKLSDARHGGGDFRAGPDAEG